MKELKIGFLQQHNTADTKDNLLRLAEGISDLAKRGAELIVLQELHNSLYFCQTENVDNFDLAEPIPGPSTKFYGELAKQFGVVIVTSLFEKRAPGLYHNTAVVMEKDGSIAGTYRKMHIPDDPAYYEKFYFTPGDLGFHPIQTSVGKLGVLVCWDQWYPEAARLMALQGAEMLIYPTAIGYESSDTPEEQQRQRNRHHSKQKQLKKRRLLQRFSQRRLKGDIEKERRSRSKFYSKVCYEMASPCASMVESNDYFADDDEPVVRPQEPEPKKNGLLGKLFGKK